MRSMLKRVLAILVSVFGMAVFTVTAGAAELYDGTAAEAKRMTTDISLDGVHLSDYTYPLVYQEFNLKNQRFLQDFELKVIMNGKEYYLHSGEISFNINTLDVLNQLWFNNEQNTQGKTYTSVYSYDKSSVQAFADKIVKDLNATVPAVKNAAPTFNPQTKTFSSGPAPGQLIGYDLDTAAFHTQVNKKINDAIWTNADHHAVLNIKSNPVYSKPDPNAASGYGRLGTYTTYTTNVPNRNTNIQLASEALNGTVVKPGGVFSFNKTLGFTSVEKGYKEAGILVNGNPETGLGGGICQVSSTLYNAVLEAGMKVVERHPHSAPVAYVPKDRDATVSYGGPDFRFQNDTPNDCYLIFEYNNRTLTVSIYGKK